MYLFLVDTCHFSGKKIEMWKRRVKELVSRVEQLSNILRTANIHLPPLALEGMPAWATNRPKHWTDKLNIADDKIDELIKRLAVPKTKPKIKKKVIKKKKKKPVSAKNKENPEVKSTVVQNPTILPNITQSGTFLLTNEGNLLPVITPTANVLTPVIINRPPVLVLQAQPQPQPIPIIISKPPSNKRRIDRESTVMTFSNKRPIPALSKQSHTRRGGKCIAHKTGNSELQAVTSSAVSPTAAFLNSFPVVTTPKIVTSEESATTEELPVEKEKTKEVETAPDPEPEVPATVEAKTPVVEKVPTPEPIATTAEVTPVTEQPPTTAVTDTRTWEAVPKVTEAPLPDNYPAISFPSSWPTQPQSQNSWLIPPIYSSENKTWRPMEPTWTNTTAEPWKVTTTQQTNFKIGLYESTSNQFPANCESTWTSQDQTWNNQQKQKKNSSKPLKLGPPIVSYGMNAFPPPLLQTTEPYTFVSDASYAAKSSFALDVSKSLFNESYGIPVPKTPVSDGNFFAYQPTCSMQSKTPAKTKNYGKPSSDGLWNTPYLPQSGNELWNQFDYSYISEPKDSRPKPPINWMTEPERTEIDDSFRQKDVQMLDFCFTGNEEDAKTRGRKKDGEAASQDYFGWVSMKVDPLVVPSTLPTLVGDLALGLVNDPVPAKKCLKTPEKNEPFANLSKNIFDNENPKQETIVLKNIFELPVNSKRSGNPGNNFLSVSQLVETQETKSDYIYYNQRTKGKRASGWKCEKKCQQTVKCSSYTAEALMRPSEQEQDYSFGLEFQPDPLEHTDMTNQQEKLKTYPAPRKPDYWRQEQNLLTKTKKPSSSLPFYTSQANLQLPPSYPRFPSLTSSPQTPTPYRKQYSCSRPPAKTPYPYPTTDNRKPVGKIHQPSYTKMLNSPSPVTYPSKSNMQQSPNPANPATPLTIGPAYPAKLGAIQPAPPPPPNQTLPSPSYLSKSGKSQPNPVIGSHLSYLSKCSGPVQNPVIGSPLPIGTTYPTFPPLPPHTPGTSGSSLANFNLSTIFPEMNKKGYQYS